MKNKKQQCNKGIQCEFAAQNKCSYFHSDIQKQQARQYYYLKQKKEIKLYYHFKKLRILFFQKIQIQSQQKAQMGVFYEGRLVQLVEGKAKIKILDSYCQFGDVKNQQKIYQQYLSKKDKNYGTKQQNPEVTLFEGEGVCKIKHGLKYIQIDRPKKYYKQIIKLYDRVNAQHSLIKDTKVKFIAQEIDRQNLQIKEITSVIHSKQQMFGRLIFGNRGILFEPFDSEVDNIILINIHEDILKQLKIEKYSFLLKVERNEEISKKHYFGKITQKYDNNIPLFQLQNQESFDNDLANIKQSIIRINKIDVIDFSPQQEKQAKKSAKQYLNILSDRIQQMKKLKKQSKQDAFTIDNQNTEIRDDAFSIKKLDTPKNQRNRYQIGIHIADVSSLISQDSKLDKMCDERFKTLYLNEYSSHMFPRVLREKFSLNEDTENEKEKEKLVTSLYFEIQSNGVIRFETLRFQEEVIKIKKNYSYEQFDEYIVKNGKQPQKELFNLMHKRAKQLQPNKKFNYQFKKGTKGRKTVQRLMKCSSEIVNYIITKNLLRKNNYIKAIRDHIQKSIKKYMEDWELLQKSLQEISKYQENIKKLKQQLKQITKQVKQQSQRLIQERKQYILKQLVSLLSGQEYSLQQLKHFGDCLHQQQNRIYQNQNQNQQQQSQPQSETDKKINKIKQESKQLSTATSNLKKYSQQQKDEQFQNQDNSQKKIQNSNDLKAIKALHFLQNNVFNQKNSLDTHNKDAIINSFNKLSQIHPEIPLFRVYVQRLKIKNKQYFKQICEIGNQNKNQKHPISAYSQNISVQQTLTQKESEQQQQLNTLGLQFTTSQPSTVQQLSQQLRKTKSSNQRLAKTCIQKIYEKYLNDFKNISRGIRQKEQKQISEKSTSTISEINEELKSIQNTKQEIKKQLILLSKFIEDSRSFSKVLTTKNKNCIMEIIDKIVQVFKKVSQYVGYSYKKQDHPENDFFKQFQNHFTEFLQNNKMDKQSFDNLKYKNRCQYIAWKNPIRSYNSLLGQRMLKMGECKFLLKTNLTSQDCINNHKQFDKVQKELNNVLRYQKTRQSDLLSKRKQKQVCRIFNKLDWIQNADPQQQQTFLVIPSSLSGKKVFHKELDEVQIEGEISKKIFQQVKGKIKVTNQFRRTIVFIPSDK